MSHSKRSVEPENVELTSMAELKPENNQENPAVSQPAELKIEQQDSMQGVQIIKIL
jgi:hypothetical protein